MKKRPWKSLWGANRQKGRFSGEQRKTKKGELASKRLERARSNIEASIWGRRSTLREGGNNTLHSRVTEPRRAEAGERSEKSGKKGEAENQKVEENL